MRGLSSDEYRQLVMSVGTHRGERKLSPVEVAGLLNKAIEAGANRKECSQALDVGPTQMSTFLRLLRLAPEVQHLADWGEGSGSTIPFSSLAQLASLEARAQDVAARAILGHRLTWKEVVQLVQVVGRSGKAIEQCIDDVVRLRPEVEIRHLFIGSLTSESLQTSLATVSQAERDSLLAEALRGILGMSEGLSGRLGTSNFTLTWDKNPAEVAGLSADAFEKAVGESVAGAIARP